MGVMVELKPIYNCSQGVLYAACELVISSLEEELVHFEGFKARYNVAFVAALRGELVAARDIPGRSQRQGVHAVLRLGLLEKLGVCMDKMAALRLYIRDAYVSASVRRVRLKEAGFDNYERAGNANWEYVAAMMDAACGFVGMHEAVLLAGDNMPADFRAELEVLNGSLRPEIVALLNARESTKMGTRDKLVANNALYERVAAVCADGVFVFRSDVARASQFVWLRVTEVVSPAGAAGLKGRVRDGATDVPIADAVVTLKGEDVPAVVVVSDGEGRYFFERLAVGRYAGRVEMEGYAGYEFEVRIKVGVVRRLDLLMG